MGVSGLPDQRRGKQPIVSQHSLTAQALAHYKDRALPVCLMCGSPGDLLATVPLSTDRGEHVVAHGLCAGCAATHDDADVRRRLRDELFRIAREARRRLRRKERWGRG